MCPARNFWALPETLHVPRRREPLAGWVSGQSQEEGSLAREPKEPLLSSRVMQSKAGDRGHVGVGQVYNTVLGNALCGRGMAGVVLWMVAARTYPDYDQFTCRLPGTDDPSSAPDDSAAVAAVLSFAQRINALNNDGPEPPTAAQ